ncbi:YqeG family HAD IIIA-type phosphatase [bacterium]|nr:YqeG family HAD IIIA-type phosphatase [bacterium]
MFIKPDYNLKSIYEIDLNKLYQDGIKGILFDLDSTLMASKSGTYTDKTYSFIKNVKEKFFMAVVSNNKNPEYIKKVSEISHFPVLFHACKPKTGIVLQFLAKHNVNPKDCVLVGDRPLTDILCGKRLGCKTILVDSITADSESKLVRFVRKLERLFIKK